MKITERHLEVPCNKCDGYDHKCKCNDGLVLTRFGKLLLGVLEAIKPIDNDGVGRQVYFSLPESFRGEVEEIEKARKGEKPGECGIFYQFLRKYYCVYD